MKHHDADRLVGVLADLQHGLITRQQARESGLTDAQIARRVAQGRWIKCEPHVFRIGGAPVTWQQRVLSACLATDGVASHRTAATLLGLGLWPVRIVEVTTDPDRNYRNPDVHVHRSVDDPAKDSSTYEGIPVTAVRRTLIDLGSVVPRDRLEKCVERALFRGLTSAGSLWAYIDEVAGKAGAACSLCERSSRSRDVSRRLKAISRPRWCTCSDGLVFQSRRDNMRSS